MENRSPPLYKRIVPLACVFVLLVSMMAFPAFAEEADCWMELLDYGYSDHGSNHIKLDAVATATREYISYKNPSGYSFNSCEILFRTDDTTPRIVTNSTWLTIVNVYDNVYRAYGTLTTSSVGTYFYLEYDDGTYIDVLSFKVALTRYDWNYTSVNGTLSILDESQPTQYIEYTNAPVTATWSPTGSISDFMWNCTFEFPDWRKFDYIDIILTCNVYNIESIIADWEKGGLTFTVTEITHTDGTEANRAFCVRIDLTSLKRQNSYDPVLRLTGDSLINRTNNIIVGSCIGYFVVEEPNVVTFWFTQLKSWFDELIAAVGGSADTSHMQQEVGNIKDQMQSASDAMNDFTRPNVGDVITDVELDIGTGTPFADMMAKFFENEFIVSIITGSLAFTLFGIIVG